MTKKIPVIGLSPMAGYTDSAFRQLVKSFCPKIKLVTELVSADWLNYTSKKTAEMINHEINEKPLSVQLFWKHPEFFVTAAQIAVKMWASEIDINMWCPAKKVIHSGHGSALILKPELAYEIVRKTKEAVNVPVTVKTRLCWDREDISEEEVTQKLITFCKWLEEAWANHLVIHWRTVKQGYAWNADWKPIYELKKNVQIPVYWNWDIKTPEDALDKIWNLDWVFVWRATVWDPWLCRRIAQAFEWKKIEDFPKWKERQETAISHMKLNIATKWMKKWMLEMRKHFALYVKGLKNAKELRNKLVRTEGPNEVFEIFKSAVE